MAMNDLSFSQIASVLTSISAQVTGVSSLAVTDTSSFVAVAQTTLKAGYDNVINAISQVLSRTIFSIRPYSRKFAGLQADSVRYGNHIRKITAIDKPFEDDDRKPLTDGTTVDPWEINKPDVLQTNFYGQSVFQKSLTIFRDQLDVAFSSPEEFGRFISMIMQNASDMIEQAHESMARLTVANLIAGKTIVDSASCIYLITEYMNETGLTGLTAANIRDPQNWVPFAKWLMGYLKTVSDIMSERTALYHQNFTGKTIMRHTPLDRQKIYLYAKDLNTVDASVLSSTFHDDYLKIADHERVNFWQAIDKPMQIDATPSYVDATGAVVSPAVRVQLGNVLGVIFDEEAAGYTVASTWSAASPFNARGGYTNMYWHFTDRYWNDFTENAVVLLLDVAP